MWRLIIPLVPPDFLWFQNLVPYPKQVQHFVSCAAPNAQEPVYKDQPSRHETITRPFAATRSPTGVPRLGVEIMKSMVQGDHKIRTKRTNHGRMETMENHGPEPESVPCWLRCWRWLVAVGPRWLLFSR